MLNGMGMNDLFDFDFEGGNLNGAAGGSSGNGGSGWNEPWGDFMGGTNN